MKFDHTNNRYMHNQESVLENGTHKLLWNFVRQMTRPNENQQKKRTCLIVDFAAPVDHTVNLKESEMKKKTYL